MTSLTFWLSVPTAFGKSSGSLPSSENEANAFPEPDFNLPEKKLLCAILGRVIADLEFYQSAPKRQKTVSNYRIALDAWYYIQGSHQFKTGEYLCDLTQILTFLYSPYEESVKKAIQEKYKNPPEQPSAPLPTPNLTPPFFRQRKKFKHYY